MTIYKRTCNYCGQYYEKQNKKYCSVRCKGLATRGKNNPLWKKPKRRCAFCGKIFKIPQNRKYCSKKCEGKARTILKLIKCRYCGKEFKPGQKRTKYCSLECSSKAKEKKYTTQCPICKKVFFIKLSRAKSKLYCSKKCYAEAQTKSLKRKRNPNWKDGISFKKRAGRRRSGYEKGKRNENKTRKILESKNYFVVRSAGSKGLWDLIAYFIGSSRQEKAKPLVRLIQVKTNYCKPGIIKAIKEHSVPSIISKEIWIWYDWSRRPEIKVL